MARVLATQAPPSDQAVGTGGGVPVALKCAAPAASWGRRAVCRVGVSGSISANDPMDSPSPESPLSLRVA